MTTEVVGWIATSLTVVAALMVALDLGRRITGWGFVVFTLASVAWIAAAMLDRDAPLGVTNFVLLGVNAFGIWRWLISRDRRAAQA